MSAATDSHPEAARESERRPRPFQFRLSTLMLAMAAAAAFCFLLRLASGKTVDEKFLIGYLAYYALAGWMVLLGKSMAASGDVRRGDRVATAGKWVFIAPALATFLFGAGLFLILLLWSLADLFHYLR